MQCVSCGHQNVEDARFCSQCGTRLGVACPSCGTWNEQASRFCNRCGTELSEPVTRRDDGDLTRYVPEELLRRIRTAQAGGAMRGERRTVTMLFADIQGSTAAAEGLDPEDWADIINGAFERLIAPVYRYEGTLARLQGDAILAFFGAPIAHEDDPIRAVRAGLDMVRAVVDYDDMMQARTGVPVAVRVGINTGLVVVGEVGSDLRVEYTALGDAINTAARMEQTAEPGTVRVTENTANLLGGMFDLESIGPVEVKGKGEPIRAFRVRAAVTAMVGRPDSSPLVGRADEQAVLQSVVTRLADGIGGVCSLVGEAGIGKSRLLSVLRADVDTRMVVMTQAAERDGDLAWLDGRSRSFDTAVPYATFADLLRRWWDVDGSRSADAWDRIADAVEHAFGSPDADTTSLLATLVGVAVPDDHAELVATLATPVLHQRTTEAIGTYLEAEAAPRPLLLVLDDLHWGDALSLAMVERLLQSTDTVALALVLAMRPYRDDASWRLLETAGREYGHRYTSVQLEALPKAATRHLLVGLLGGTPPDDETSRRVLDRANGNPLFVEELVRSLGDDAAGNGVAPPFGQRIDVPTSLTSLLTARLDQLDETARLVAQVAAVVGREFGPRPLAALLDGVDVPENIAELVRRGILSERRRVPEPVYAFRHALIQETAYSTVLLRTRRELHRRLAEYLEETQPEGIQEIARHHLESGARARAFPYLVEAGQHATRTMALADAIQLFTTALDAVPADVDPTLMVRAYDGLGEAYGLIPDLPHASATYQRLLDYGRSYDQPSIQVTALNRLGMTTATHAADFPRAEQYLADARRIAETSGDELGLAEYHMNACMLATLQGEMERAIDHDVETTRIGTIQGSEEIRLVGLVRRALNLVSATKYAEAEPALTEAVEAAEALADTESLALIQTAGSAGLALRAGDLHQAQRMLDQGIPILDRFGSFHAGRLHAQAAGVAIALGDLEGAIARAGEARRISEQNGQTFVAGVAAAYMAHAYALCGITDSQEQLRESALQSFVPPWGDFVASTTWAELGWANLAVGAVAEATEDFVIGLGVSSITRFWERPRLLIGSAFAALGHSDAADARRLLDEATTYVAERAIRLHDADLAFGAGLVAMVEDRVTDAEVALERAQRLAAAFGRRLVERDVAEARSNLAQITGRSDAAAQHLGNSRRITEAIASAIADEQLRTAFVTRSAAILEQRRPVSGP